MTSGPKIVALAALVDAEVGFEHLGDLLFLVAEARLAEHLGFEVEAHEVLGLLALDEDLRPFS